MPASPIDLARKALSLARPSSLRLRPGRCSACGPTLLIRLGDDAISVRCLRCRASAIHLSMLQVLCDLYPDLSATSVYELSSRGPVFEYLRRRAGQLTYSEFFDDTQPGAMRQGVRCEDVQRLTFAGASFDLCTSTEVFEHVPDDMTGFREIRRVLKPGGRFVFTVPLTDLDTTIERATLENGKIRHLLTPEYHGDAIRGYGRVLCFRNYGADILQRLESAGFSAARFEAVDCGRWWGFGTRVVVAEA